MFVVHRASYVATGSDWLIFSCIQSIRIDGTKQCYHFLGVFEVLMSIFMFFILLHLLENWKWGGRSSTRAIVGTDSSTCATTKKPHMPAITVITMMVII